MWHTHRDHRSQKSPYASGVTIRLSDTFNSQLLDALEPDAHPFIGIVGHRVVDRSKGTWDLKILWLGDR